MTLDIDCEEQSAWQKDRLGFRHALVPFYLFYDLAQRAARDNLSPRQIRNGFLIVAGLETLKGVMYTGAALNFYSLFHDVL